MNFIVKNRTFLNPPINAPLVYKIIIGDKVYIGSTIAFGNRMYYHINVIKKIVTGKCILPYIKSSYLKFLKEDIINYGCQFEIHSYCADIKTARVIEQLLINKYKRNGALLNAQHSVIKPVKKIISKKKKRIIKSKLAIAAFKERLKTA